MTHFFLCSELSESHIAEAEQKYIKLLESRIKQLNSERDTSAIWRQKPLIQKYKSVHQGLVIPPGRLLLPSCRIAT